MSKLLNIHFLERLKEEGVSIQKVGRITSKVNPIERLFEKGKLTREEFNEAKDYQFSYALSNLSNHARPSHNSLGGGDSGKPKDFHRKDSQIRAATKVLLAKTEISKHRGLLPILLHLFESERSVNWCEKNLHVNHALVEERVKKICNILEKINGRRNETVDRNS